MYNNGFFIVHGIQGYVSHLSSISCRIESMTTLSFPFLPPPTAAFAATRVMLKDVMGRLRTGGYTLVALAMRVKYPELSDLKSMTVFAMDDLSIFGIGIGHEYVANLGFHIVPNRLLMSSELAELAPNTEKNYVASDFKDVMPELFDTLYAILIFVIPSANDDWSHNETEIVEVVAGCGAIPIRWYN
uniref:Uncharacterized protein n=1 Tax=Solanum lycopersicum TaxID=4081 RepID=A0A3Q7IZZ7_SOLLC